MRYYIGEILFAHFFLGGGSPQSLIKVLGLVGLGLEIRFCRFPIGAGSVGLRYLEQLIIFECPPSSGSIQKVPNPPYPGGYGSGILKYPLSWFILGITLPEDSLR